jgi:membrane glycosyltransferase
MIETIIFPKKKYTIQECFGDITKEELLETAQSFFGGAHTPYVIWDFSFARMINLSPNTIQRLVDICNKQRARRGGGKTAIIAPAYLEYSFSRMFETIPELNNVSFEMKVFGSLGEAKQWFSE